MTDIPGWPLSLPADLAERYEEPAADLFRRLGRRPALFERALDLALAECESARQYGKSKRPEVDSESKWPELKERENIDTFRHTFEPASRAAITLAVHLEADDFNARRRVARAAEATGLSLKTKDNEQPHLALAAFLHAFADLKGKRVKEGWHPHGSLKIYFGNENRIDMPDKAVVLCLSLAHIFRILVDAGQVKILHLAGPIGACAFWNEAAAFTCATFEEVPTLEADKVKDRTEKFRKRHAGGIAYRGWR